MLPKRKTKDSPPPQKDNELKSVVEMLQSQIEEERAQARNKAKKISQDDAKAKAARKILQKKNSPQKTEIIAEASAAPPPIQVTPPSSPPPNRARFADSSAEPDQKHASEGVGSEEPPKKQMVSKNFTYFDMLTERSIYDDPLKDLL